MSAGPGWFPDPAGQPGLYRYWDGRAWTAATRPSPGPARSPGSTRSRTGAWLAAVVAVVVVVVLAVVLAVRVVGGQLVADPPPPPPTGANLCQDAAAPSAESGPSPQDRVRSGKLSYPRLGAPFRPPRTDYRVPFGRDVQSQEATVEQRTDGTPTWIASVLIARLLAGDGFYGPEQGAEVVADCVTARFYGEAEVRRTDRRNQATQVDGRPAWLIESQLSFELPDIETTGELMILVVVDVGDGEGGLYYASIPDTSPQFVPPAREALANLRVDG